jgi:hypothetical protein
MVLTVSFVISPVIGLCLSPSPAKTSADLTPASRRQDHTTSPSASRAVRQRRIRVHRIPSRVCDDRERPSDGTRRAKDAGDLGLRQSGIFFRAGLDRWNQLEPAGKIRLPRLCRFGISRATALLLPLAEPQIMLRRLPLDGYMQSEWAKPREYSFTNAAGDVFHEIAYSRQDVNLFAKMHKATSYRPTEDGSICKLLPKVQ